MIETTPLDLDQYKGALFGVQNILKTVDDCEEPPNEQDKFTRVALATGLPLIVTCYFMMHLQGHSDFLQAKADRLCEFYSVHVKGLDVFPKKETTNE